MPEAGRETIDRSLQNSDVRYNTLQYAAEHAFTRDEGPRFDPEPTDLAFAEWFAYSVEFSTTEKTWSRQSCSPGRQ